MAEFKINDLNDTVIIDGNNVSIKYEGNALTISAKDDKETIAFIKINDISLNFLKGTLKNKNSIDNFMEYEYLNNSGIKGLNITHNFIILNDNDVKTLDPNQKQINNNIYFDNKLSRNKTKAGGSFSPNGDAFASIQLYIRYKA